MRRVMLLYESIGELPDPALLAGFVPRGEEDAVAGQLLRPCFSRQRETALLLAFDTFARLVAMEQTSGGGEGQCHIPARNWRAMLRTGVTGVLMAHNHPSGAPWPSAVDFAATREAAHLLRLVGIELVDHQIFVGNGHFSFRRGGLL